MMELQNYKEGSRKQQTMIKSLNLGSCILEALSSWGSSKQRAKTYKVHFIEKYIKYNIFKYTYDAYNSL